METTIAHPLEQRIPIMGGREHAVVRPWTMAQRASIKPRIMDIVGRVTGVLTGTKLEMLGALINDFEPELLEIARETVVLPEHVDWDQLDWADGPTLIQAIWDVSILGPAGEGLLGKLVGLAQMGGQLVGASRPTETSPPKSCDEPMPSGSPSSPDAGEPAPINSATS